MDGLGCREDTIPIIYLLGEDDDQTSEDAHEVDEEVEGVRDEITATLTSLLDDQLSVVEDETAHHDQPQVEMYLEQPLGAEEEVGQGEEDHRVEDGHQSAAQIQVFSSFGQHRADGEAHEDHSRTDEGGDDDVRINVHDLLQQWPQSDSTEERESQQVAQTLQHVLALLIGCHHQQTEADQRPDAGEEASLQVVGVHMDS